jgi:hypothetical protein
MRDALANYASYRASEDRSALGRFIVPVSRLKELEDVSGNLMPRGREDPWRLSVLVAGDVDAAVEKMLTFNNRHQAESDEGSAVIDVAELKAATADEIARLSAELPDSFTPYFEIPIAGDLAPLVQAIARAGARAKIRTGGVTPQTIPPAEQVISFITACWRERTALKATAGLHHPIRGSYKLTYEPNSPVGTMYGFRVVAYAAGDTARCGWRGPNAPVTRRPFGAESCFHTNVFIYSDGQTRLSGDTSTATSYVLPLCGKIYHVALGELEILK